jgi:hypothetical protein
MKSLTIDCGSWKVGEVKRIAVFSDPHIKIFGDNSRLKRDIDQAVFDGCRLCFNGDISDFIYHMDKRYVPELDEGEATNAKLDQGVDFIVDFLEPYKDYIDFIGYGNHETVAIRKYHSDPVARVCKRLGCEIGAYRALVRYRWIWGDTSRTLTVYYHHGGKGVATQNKGILAIRNMVLGAEADVYIVGHGHRAAIDGGEPRYYLDHKGNVKTKIRKGMQVPGYQDRESPTGTGYEDRFYQPTAQGYGIIEVTTKRDGIGYNLMLRVD